MLRTPAFFNLFATAYDLITDQGYWERAIDHALDRVPRLDGARRVLDLGCGPGVSAFVIARRLPEAEVVGVDIAHRMIARAEAHLARQPQRRVEFHVADASALPFDDGSFDLALGHSFLYLVEDRQRVTAEIRRVLAPRGTLVLLEPHADGRLWRAAWDARHHMSGAAGDPWGAARFAASMLLWRAVSGGYGRLTKAEVQRLLGAHFADVRAEPTLGGLGLHCVATGRR